MFLLTKHGRDHELSIKYFNDFKLITTSSKEARVLAIFAHNCNHLSLFPLLFGMTFASAAGSC